VDLPQGRCDGAVEPAAADGAARDQPGLVKHAQVLRDRREGHAEPRDQLLDRSLALGQRVEQRARVGSPIAR
jgi:hypothetical protein